MIKFDSEICTDFESASTREWLETNGIGGFASSTISGANTRRYHALLTAATKPPLGRLVLLSKFEETLTIGGRSFEISSNKYPNKIHPSGFKYLKNFRLDPFPVWTFEVEGIEIEKKIFMVNGENTVICQWSEKSKNQGQRTKDKGQILLELKPLLAFRDYHHLRQETENFDGGFQISDKGVSVKPLTEMPALFFSHNAENVEQTGFWYRDFEYAVEQERGFDFRENLFQPFALKFDLSDAAVVIASTESRDFSNAGNFEKSEIKRRKNLIKTAGAKTEFHKNLVLAADQYIAARGDGKTSSPVIRGFPIGDATR